jgi:transcription elongation factor Elf1
MESNQLKKHHVEQFEVTPTLIREHLVFVGTEDFIKKMPGLPSAACCPTESENLVAHSTKNGLRYTRECSACGAKSVMAKTPLMAKLSWYQKFANWEALRVNPLFKGSMAAFVDGLETHNDDSQVYYLLEMLANLNVYNHLHDANKKRVDSGITQSHKYNLDAISMLLRAAQKSVTDKLCEHGIVLSAKETVSRLDGLKDKIVKERRERLAAMTEEKRNQLSDVIAVFESRLSK